MRLHERVEVIGDCTLYLGDCREVVLSLGPVDAVVTDPPYGIGKALTSGGSGRGFHKMTTSGADEWDVPPDKSFLEHLMSVSKHQIFWGGNYLELPPTRKPLCWDKMRPNQKNLSEWEMAWTSLVGRAEKFEHCANGGFAFGEDRVHPTQKPTPLMLWCLEKIPDAKKILDPFMGSGTTGVACAKWGRTFIGIEREQKYFDIACRRVEEAYRQPDFLAAAGSQ